MLWDNGSSLGALSMNLSLARSGPGSGEFSLPAIGPEWAGILLSVQIYAQSPR